GHMRPQATLQIKGRQMKMPGARDIFKINVFRFQVKDRSRIRQNIPPVSMLQDYAETGLSGGVADDFVNMDSTSSQARKCDVSKGIAANARNKAHATAQGSQIMGHDGGSAPERQ